MLYEVITTSSLVGLVQELGVIDFPFAVDTYRQGFALVDGRNNFV